MIKIFLERVRLTLIFIWSCIAIIRLSHVSNSPHTLFGWSSDYLIFTLLPIFIVWLIWIRFIFTKGNFIRCNLSLSISLTVLTILLLIFWAINGDLFSGLLAKFFGIAFILSIILELIVKCLNHERVLLASIFFHLMLFFIVLWELPRIFLSRSSSVPSSWSDDTVWAYTFSDREPFVGQGGRFNRDVSLLIQRPGVFLGTSIFRTDSYGFRNSDISSQSKIPKILSLGDSFALGFGMSQDRFLGTLLEERLEQDGNHIPIFSAEVSNPVVGLYYLQNYGSFYKPPIILYSIYLANDILQDFLDTGLPVSRMFFDESGALKRREGASRKEVQNYQDTLMRGHRYSSNSLDGENSKGSKKSIEGCLPAFQVNESIRTNRALYDISSFGILSFVSELFQSSLEARRGLRPEYLASYGQALEFEECAKSIYEPGNNLALFLKKDLPDLEMMWQQTERAFKEMNTIATKQNSKLIISIIPVRIQVQEQDWKLLSNTWQLMNEHFDLKKPNNRLSDFCRREGLECIDLLEPLTKAALREQLYLVNDSHWNERGHEVASEVIAERIKKILKTNNTSH